MLAIGDQQAVPRRGEVGARRILVAEGDGMMRSLLVDILSQHGYEVENVAGAPELDAALHGGPEADRGGFEVVVASWKLLVEAAGEGAAVAALTKPTIVITPFGDGEAYYAMRCAGAAAILVQPFVLAELLETVWAVLPKRPNAASGAIIGSEGK